MHTSFKLVVGALLIWPALSSSVPKDKDLDQRSTIDTSKEARPVYTTWSELEGWEEYVIAYDDAQAQFYNKLSKLTHEFIKVALNASYQALRALGDTPDELKEFNTVIFELFGVDPVDPEPFKNGIMYTPDVQPSTEKLKNIIKSMEVAELCRADNFVSALIECSYGKITAELIKYDIGNIYKDCFQDMMSEARSFDSMLQTVGNFFKTIISNYNAMLGDTDPLTTGHKYAAMAHAAIMFYINARRSIVEFTSAMDVYTKALEAAQSLSCALNIPENSIQASRGVLSATPRPKPERCRQTYILNHTCNLLETLNWLKEVIKKPIKMYDLAGPNNF